VSDHAFIAEGEALFNEEGVDPITADGGPVGPDWYFESKKFDAGDSTRLKKFKQLMLHYLVQGGEHQGGHRHRPEQHRQGARRQLPEHR
jgi:hypothetical protein